MPLQSLRDSVIADREERKAESGKLFAGLAWGIQRPSLALVRQSYLGGEGMELDAEGVGGKVGVQRDDVNVAAWPQRMFGHVPVAGKV